MDTKWMLCVLTALTVCTANTDKQSDQPDCAQRSRAKALEAEQRQDRGDLAGAERILRELLSHLDASKCEGAPAEPILTRLGHTLQLQGRFRDAEEIYRGALRMRSESGGLDSADVASSMSDIATAVLAVGRADEAEQLLRESLAILSKTLGPRHDDTLVVKNNLGVLLLVTGQHARAEPVLRAVAAGLEAIEPRPVRLLARCYQNLARAHYGQREISEAEHYTRLHLELSEASGSTAGTSAALLNLIAIHVEQKRFAEAESLLARVSNLVAPETESLNYALLLTARAAVRKSQKRYQEAGSDLRQAIALLDGGGGFQTAAMSDALEALSSVLRKQGLKAESKRVKKQLDKLTAGQGGDASLRAGEKSLGVLLAPSALSQQ
jgi:tetratricopeptide (TPR) repeat protein